ncbi:hypothetical protein E1H99_02775 [Enterococcus hirae]|nr:hypothetical protein E1H99_02775 [Enterococcus hirae]
MKKILTFGLFLLSFFFILFSGLRIHSINKETPKTFDVQEFKKNEVASLNCLEISLVSSKTGEKSHYDGENPEDQYTLMPLTVELMVKNSSNVDQDITTLFENQLMTGYSPYNTTNVKADLKLLKPNETTTISMIFTIDADVYVKNDTYFIISTQSLLKFDKENYSKNYHHGKYKGIIFKV